MKNQKIPVLCYHDILPSEKIKKLTKEEKKFVIEAENFKKQMFLLKIFGYKTLTLDEFYNWKKKNKKLPYKSILITFDDGYLNVYKYAMPILKKYKQKACVFTIGSKIKNKKYASKYMNLDVINCCKKDYPNIEFACHSFDLHNRGSVESKTEEELKKDLTNYANFFVNTKYFAYPYGHYTNNIINALKETNYRLAFIFSKPKKAQKTDNDFLIPRINVSFTQNHLKFIIKILLPFIY